MKSESTYILEILTLLDKAKNESYLPKEILSKVSKHLEIVEENPINTHQMDKIIAGNKSNSYKIIESIIKRFEYEKPEITLYDLSTEAKKHNIPSEEVIKILDKLKQEGIVFEPKKEIYKKL